MYSRGLRTALWPFYQLCNRRSQPQSDSRRRLSLVGLRLLQAFRLRKASTLPGQQQSCPVRFQEGGADTFGAFTARSADMTPSSARRRRRPRAAAASSSSPQT